MRRPAFAYLLAASSIALDGVSVAAWYAARELDDRPRDRRRVRAMVLAGVATVAVAQTGADLAWHRPGPEGEGEGEGRVVPREDAVAFGRYAAVALVATAVMWPIEKRAPQVLARRGAARPHLAFGVLAGTAYALAAAPVWLRHARDRIDAGPCVPVGAAGSPWPDPDHRSGA